MKTFIFSAMAVAALLLVGLQHQQLGQLRGENATLQQASAEADQLKADLANSTGNEAQEAEEVNRLREENRDLLKLRNEINQLRDARGQFEKVSAENQRLVSLARSAPKAQAKDAMQPVAFRFADAFDRGLSTPEFALQTFYWALRERNSDAFSGSVARESWNKFRDYAVWDGWRRQSLDDIISVEIVARRDVDATTVQLGVQLHEAKNPQVSRKIVVTLVLQGSDWRVKETTN